MPQVLRGESVCSAGCLVSRCGEAKVNRICILFGGWVVFRGNRTLEGATALGIEDTVSLSRHSPMFQRMCPAWRGE